MTPQRLAFLELSCRIPYLAEHPALLSRPPRVSGCLPLLVPSVAHPLRLVSDLQCVLVSTLDLAADELALLSWHC